MIDNSKGITKVLHLLHTRIIAVIALALICAITVFAAVSSAYSVAIIDGEETLRVYTSKTDWNDVLAQADIVLGELDEVDTSDFKPGEPSSLSIQRAQDVTILDNGEELSVTVPAGAIVADALDAANLALAEEDTLVPAKDTLVTPNMTVTISRTISLRLVADGKTHETKLMSGTVSDLLEAYDIQLGENDEVSPKLNKQLNAGMSVVVKRVRYETVTAEVAIPFSEKVEKTPSLSAGQKKVVTKGVRGRKEVTTEKKIVDGKVVESNVLKETVLKKPTTQKVQLGMNSINIRSGKQPISQLKMPASLKLDKNGVPTNYKKIIEGKAVSYSGGGRTATGKKAQTGYIAVNPKQIPYGTKMWIVSLDGKYVYGYASAEDTGGFVKRGTADFDLYMNTTEECRQFGARQVRIYIL